MPDTATSGPAPLDLLDVLPGVFSGPSVPAGEKYHPCLRCGRAVPYADFAEGRFREEPAGADGPIPARSCSRRATLTRPATARSAPRAWPTAASACAPTRRPARAGAGGSARTCVVRAWVRKETKRANSRLLILGAVGEFERKGN
jgi:hypothetical protein